MFCALNGEVVEVGHTEFDGKQFPFCKVYTKLGSKTDLVRVGLSNAQAVKVGEKANWVIEIKLAENDHGKGRLSVKRSE